MAHSITLPARILPIMEQCRHQPTEGSVFSKTSAEPFANKHGVSVPILVAARTNLQVYEAGRIKA